MATVTINLVKAKNRGGASGASLNMPVPASVQEATEDLETSATSQATTITSSDAFAGEFWDVVVSGGNVRLAFGADPTAQEDAGWLVLDGERIQFGASGPGEKLAVIDAA